MRVQENLTKVQRGGFWEEGELKIFVRAREGGGAGSGQQESRPAGQVEPEAGAVRADLLHRGNSLHNIPYTSWIG